jgi:hypothetical protein
MNNVNNNTNLKDFFSEKPFVTHVNQRQKLFPLVRGKSFFINSFTQSEPELISQQIYFLECGEKYELVWCDIDSDLRRKFLASPISG